MANLLKIKRNTYGSSTVPSSLSEGELAYSQGDNKLYIGTNGGADVTHVNVDTNTTYSSATTTAEGIVELATNTEATAGTDTTRAVTPSGVKAAIDDRGYSTTTGTVTSVGLSAPTGLSVSGSPITSSGTLALSYDTGYAIPTTAKQTNWDSVYTWYQEMISTDDVDSVIDTWAELVASLNNAGESVNILNNSSTIDGGTF